MVVNFLREFGRDSAIARISRIYDGSRFNRGTSSVDTSALSIILTIFYSQDIWVGESSIALFGGS